MQSQCLFGAGNTRETPSHNARVNTRRVDSDVPPRRFQGRKRLTVQCSYKALKYRRNRTQQSTGHSRLRTHGHTPNVRGDRAALLRRRGAHTSVDPPAPTRNTASAPDTDRPIVRFDLGDESQGTQKVFALAGPLLDVLGGGGLMILDEFDARLHPLLSRTILRQFNTAASNPQHAQLVLTTRDTTILNKETLRRDQVWFTEKGRDAGTRLFSLAELKVRNDASYAKDYVTGRYGAIPFVRNIDLPRADPRAPSASPRASKHPH